MLAQLLPGDPDEAPSPWFGMAQPWLLQPFVKGTRGWRNCLCICLYATVSNK